MHIQGAADGHDR